MPCGSWLTEKRSLKKPVKSLYHDSCQPMGREGKHIISCYQDKNSPSLKQKINLLINCVLFLAKMMGKASEQHTCAFQGFPMKSTCMLDGQNKWMEKTNLEIKAVVNSWIGKAPERTYCFSMSLTSFLSKKVQP